MPVSLTDKAIKAMKPPARWQTEVFDKGFPGLAIRLGPGGSKTFVFIYRRRGKLRRITLGTYPALTLAKARELWRAAKIAIAAGKVPTPPHRRQIGDFLHVAELWLERDQGGKRTVVEARRVITKYCRPLHAMPIGDVTRHDVREVLHGVKGKTMPRRVYSRLHRLFVWARSEDWIETDPMAGLAKPGVEVKRDRVLSDDELVKVWMACDPIGWPFGPIVKLLILTGARRNEIGALRWAEIVDDVIRLKRARTKTGVEHDIPLGSLAVEIIANLPHIEDSELVFPSARNTELSAWSAEKRRLDEIAKLSTPWRLHDLRRTVATGLQKLGTPLQVTEAVLGHTSGSRGGIVGIYQRHHYAEEKKAALERWGGYVGALVTTK